MNTQTTSPTPSKKTLAKLYKRWCEETNRNGSVLVGKSIREFLAFLSEQTDIPLGNFTKSDLESDV